MKKIFLAALCLLGMAALPVQAQKLHVVSGLESSHLWRGLEVSKGVTLNNEFAYQRQRQPFPLWSLGRYADRW